MNLKQIMLSLAAATAMFASAQNQGYQDGIEYFKADQFDNAKEILSNTLNAPGTDRAEALYYLGAIALHDGDAATARKNFEEGIALDPKNGLNYVGLGAIALKEGNAKAAEDYFKQATKAQNKAFVHVAIARAYYNADKVAYAKEYDKFMDNAVRKDKKEPSYYVMRGDALRDRAEHGKTFSIIAVAEGAMSVDEAKMKKKERAAYREEIGFSGIANYLAKVIQEKMPEIEARAVIPGHMQRGGSPSAYDRMLSTNFGVHAAQLIAGEQYGQAVGMTNNVVTHNPLSTVAGKTKFVPRDGHEVRAARAMGISLGDKQK